MDKYDIISIIVIIVSVIGLGFCVRYLTKHNEPHQELQINDSRLKKELAAHKTIVFTD